MRQVEEESKICDWLIKSDFHIQVGLCNGKCTTGEYEGIPGWEYS